MNIKKIRKLLHLPKKEIAFRLREKCVEDLEYVFHVLGQDGLTDRKWPRLLTSANENQAPVDGALEYFKRCTRDRFFTEIYDKTKRLSLIKKHFPYQDWLDEADQIHHGDLTLLGLDVMEAFQNGWHQDPLEKISWPLTFYTRVKHDPRIKDCDIKFIWELNRHQYLIVLAKEYWLTGKEEYAEKVIAIIQDWIRENPYHSGVNWTSSLELAVRALAWIWSYFLCAGSVHITPDFHNTFIQSIYEHGHHIEKHLSFYSSPYNHLIGELAALHVIGSLFPQFKDSRNWETLGWNTLVDQVEKQFHEDGLTVEQATFYHHFTLGFYLQSVLLRKINNKDVPDKVLSRLEIALDFCLYMTKPDGSLPMVGDIDNARSLYFNTRHSWDFRGFLGLGAILFKRQDFKFACRDLTEEVIWLCDDGQVENFLSMSGNPPHEKSKGFYKSGYFISRDSWLPDSNYLCFDCGEIADGLSEGEIPSAAHGHADALSFELSAFGKPFLVDGGFHTYFGQLEWHKHFRGETAHNTIQLGNHRQANYCGRLTWNFVKDPQLINWSRGARTDRMAGRIQYNNNTWHQREIVYMKGFFWIICDSIGALEDNLTATSSLHFAPSVDLAVYEESKLLTAQDNNTGILIQYFTTEKPQNSRGGNAPEQGWQAKGYGYKEPAWCTRFEIDLRYEKKLIPLIIIPWQDSPESAAYSYAPANTVINNNIFKTTFAMEDNTFAIVVDHESGITVSQNGRTIEYENPEDS